MNGLIERAIPIRKPHNESDLAGGAEKGVLNVTVKAPVKLWTAVPTVRLV